jgi:hypothetical protein
LDAVPKTRLKSDLPQKICGACGRAFSWRRKWAKDWDQVKTCSERCKGEFRRNSKSTAARIATKSA